MLELSGVEVTLQKIHVQTEEQARALGFVSSPTLRINGRDIQMVRGNPMNVTLANVADICRDWVYQGHGR